MVGPKSGISTRSSAKASVCPIPAGSTLPNATGPSLNELMNMAAEELREQQQKMRAMAISQWGGLRSPSSTQGVRASDPFAISASNPLANPISAQLLPIAPGVAGRSDDVDVSVRCSLLGPSLLFRKFVCPFASRSRRTRKSKWYLRAQAHAKVRHLPLQPPALPLLLLLLLRMEPHPLTPQQSRHAHHPHHKIHERNVQNEDQQKT